MKGAATLRLTPFSKAWKITPSTFPMPGKTGPSRFQCLEKTITPCSRDRRSRPAPTHPNQSHQPQLQQNKLPLFVGGAFQPREINPHKTKTTTKSWLQNHEDRFLPTVSFVNSVCFSSNHGGVTRRPPAWRASHAEDCAETRQPHGINPHNNKQPHPVAGIGDPGQPQPTKPESPTPATAERDEATG